MLKRRFGFAMVVAAALCQCPASAQNRGPAITLRSIANSENVLSVLPWTVGSRDLLVIVTDRRVSDNGETGLSRALTVYSRRGDGLVKAFEYQTLDGFISAFPLSETGGRLFAAWTGGSAYHFSVYSSNGGPIKEVLQAGSRGMPEIVIGQDENESILVTQKQLVGGEWRRTKNSTTDIYVWNGTDYKLARTVPWNTRFTATVTN